MHQSTKTGCILLCFCIFSLTDLYASSSIDISYHQFFTLLLVCLIILISLFFFFLSKTRTVNKLLLEKNEKIIQLNNEIKTNSDKDQSISNSILNNPQRQLSLLFNYTEDIIGLIRIENNTGFFIESFNQSGINFLTTHFKYDKDFNFSGLPISEFMRNILLLPEEEVIRRIKFFNKAVLLKKRFSYDVTNSFKEGAEKKHFKVTLTPIINESTGDCEQIMFVSHDITNRIKTRQALLKSEKRLSTIYNASNDFIGLYCRVKQGEYFIESINHTSIQFLIKNDLISKAEDMIGMNARTLLKNIFGVEQDQIEDRLQNLEHVFIKQEATVFNNSIIQKDKGIHFDFETVISPIIDNQGICTHALFSSRDITNKKRIETELLSSEAHAQTLFEYSPIIIWDEDFSEIKKVFDNLKTEGLKDFRRYFDEHPEKLEELALHIKVKDVNQKSIDFYNMGSKENHIKDIPFYFVEDSWDVLKEEFIALAEGKTSFESEIPIKKRDGSIVQLILNLSIPPSYEDTWESIIVSFIDITERKEAVLLLEKSKKEINKQLERNQLILETTLNGYVLTDMKGKIVDVNSTYSSLTGFSKEELLTMNISELEVHISPEEINEHIQLLMKNGHARFETAHRKKDGNSVTFDASLNFMRQDESPMIAAFLRDITGQKRAQEELEYRYKFESLLAKISTHFINLNITEIDKGINDSLEQICLFTDFDRIMITLLNNEKNATNIHYEWFKPHMKPLKLSFQNVSISAYPWLFEKLLNNESVIIQKLEDLPTEATGAIETSNQMREQTLIQVPMVWQGEVIGFVGLNNKEEKKNLSKDLETLLRFAGEMIINVLQRKKGEEALLFSKERMSSVFNTTKDQMAIFNIQPDGKFILEEVNQSLKNGLKIAGIQLDPTTFYGKDLQEYNNSLLHLSESNIYSQLETLNKAIKDKKTYYIEEEFTALNNNVYTMAFTISPMLKEDNTCDKVLIAARDITFKKKANELLISKILETEDRERKRISKELHDSLGQNLTTASLNFIHLKDAINQNDDQNQQRLIKGLKFLNIAIGESRNIAHNLMPLSIVDFGYVFTLESLVEDLSQSSNTNFVFYSNLQDQRLAPDIELSLFRITQEAINNILKHAKASKATIQLMKYTDTILLTIEDNGKGFDIKKINGHAFGINSISTRASAMSATIDIDSEPGKGTSITVSIEAG